MHVNIFFLFLVSKFTSKNKNKNWTSKVIFPITYQQTGNFYKKKKLDYQQMKITVNSNSPFPMHSNKKKSNPSLHELSRVWSLDTHLTQAGSRWTMTSRNWYAVQVMDVSIRFCPRAKDPPR